MGTEQGNNRVDQLLNQLSVRTEKTIGKLVQQRMQLKRMTRKAESLGVQTHQLQSDLARQEEEKRLLIKKFQGYAEQCEQQSDDYRQLVDANQSLTEQNQLLENQHHALKEENERLNHQLKSLQERLKAIAELGLHDSSEAILTMIKESLDIDDTPADDPRPALPVPDKFSAKEILDQWCQRYPKAFSIPCLQPLKVGIHEDLARHESIPDHWIRRALASYVRSPRYLRLLKAGAVRLDLEGNNAGFIGEQEAHHAQEQLEEIRQQRLEKERVMREKDEARRMNSKLEQLVTRHS